MKEKLKKILKVVGYTILGLITLLIVLYLCGEITNQYNYNHKYSIAMPTIVGMFETNNDYVNVYGLENSFEGDLRGLHINDTSCFLSINQCIEKRAVVTGFGNQIGIYAYYDEYAIKYADKNKIIFSNLIGNVTGEIDLNLKTLIYTIKNQQLKNGFEKIEIITDNKEIEKLEKKIIRKNLKKEWFKL